MEKQDVIEFFDRAAGTWDAEMIKNDTIINRILDNAEVGEGMSVLDVACGTGVLCRILQDGGIRSRGMDLSEGMIAIAREANPDIPFDVADMITYRPQRQFDLVTCTGDAVNHISDLSDVEKIFQILPQH